MSQYYGEEVLVIMQKKATVSCYTESNGVGATSTRLNLIDGLLYYPLSAPVLTLAALLNLYHGTRPCRAG
eukprot:scaffold11269_cov60-Phaeocystis_antarctica.AAC.4